MRVQIDYKAGNPVYLQIVEQVKYAAATGAMRPGEHLPPIRPLAEKLRINRNTVAKAYNELENQGVIETLHGKGSILSNNDSPLKKSVRQRILTTAIDANIVEAHHLQIDQNEFLELVKERLAAFKQKSNV